MQNKVPFNRLSLSADVIDQLMRLYSDVLANGKFVQGPEHDKFEQAFAKYCGVEYCLGVANGTDAIEIALRASGIREGDEVVLQANAGFYSSTALFAIGAIPVYADINEHDHQLNIESVVRCLSPQTKAVIMTHLYGKIGDVETMRALCEQKEILLIEDCAQSHGAIVKEKKAGAWGDVSTFSFYPTKNLGALGDAGSICTSSDIIANEVKLIRQYGWVKKYNVSKIGRNSRLDEIQASILNYKLPFLDNENKKRRRIVSMYAESCRGELQMIHGNHGLDYVGHLAVATHPRRDSVMDKLKCEGIDATIHYPILDTKQSCIELLDFRSDKLTNSEKTNKEIFSLPCYPGITKEEIQHVCSVLNSVK